MEIIVGKTKELYRSEKSLRINSYLQILIYMDSKYNLLMAIINGDFSDLYNSLVFPTIISIL